MVVALGGRCDDVVMAANIARGPRTPTSGHAVISAVTRAMNVRRGVVDRARDTRAPYRSEGFSMGPYFCSVESSPAAIATVPGT